MTDLGSILTFVGRLIVICVALVATWSFMAGMGSLAEIVTELKAIRKALEAKGEPRNWLQTTSEVMRNGRQAESTLPHLSCSARVARHLVGK